MRRALLVGILAAGCLTQYEVDRTLATQGGEGSGSTSVAAGSSGSSETAGVACPEQCRPGEDCVDGECVDTCEDACDRFTELCANEVCSCRPGLTACGGACVDILASAPHCGGCDDPCAQVCEGGQCVASCTAPNQECGGACVDTATDAQHCGACNDPCDADEVCVAGDCRDYEQAPCDSCPCDECGSEVCCDVPPIPGPICVNENACP